MPLWGQFPSNTMWPGPRPASIPSSILIHPAVWPQQALARKLWGRGLYEALVWRAGVVLAPAILCCWMGTCPHPTQYGWCRVPRPTPCLSSWSIHPFDHNTLTLQTDIYAGQRSDSIGRTAFYKNAPKKRSPYPIGPMSVLCPICLSVTSLCEVGYCGQTLEWIKMKLAWRPRPRRHCVRWGPSNPPQKGGTAAPNFRPMYCRKMAGLLWPNARPF